MAQSVGALVAQLRATATAQSAVSVRSSPKTARLVSYASDTTSFSETEADEMENGIQLDAAAVLEDVLTLTVQSSNGEIARSAQLDRPVWLDEADASIELAGLAGVHPSPVFSPLSRIGDSSQESLDASRRVQLETMADASLSLRANNLTTFVDIVLNGERMENDVVREEESSVQLATFGNMRAESETAHSASLSHSPGQLLVEEQEEEEVDCSVFLRELSAATVSTAVLAVDLARPASIACVSTSANCSPFGSEGGDELMPTTDQIIDGAADLPEDELNAASVAAQALSVVPKLSPSASTFDGQSEMDAATQGRLAKVSMRACSVLTPRLPSNSPEAREFAAQNAPDLTGRRSGNSRVKGKRPAKSSKAQKKSRTATTTQKTVETTGGASTAKSKVKLARRHKRRGQETEGQSSSSSPDRADMSPVDTDCDELSEAEVPKTRAARARAKRLRRRSVSPAESLASLDSRAPRSPRAKRQKKGDLETRKRATLMANPDQLFAHAEPAAERTGRAKKGQRGQMSQSLPTNVLGATIPPCQIDQDRPVKSAAELTDIANHFVNNSDAVLSLLHFQHGERLQLLRGILPVAYAGERDVRPLLRLLQQNGRQTNDPLVMIAAALRPELIDTSRGTHAAGAHFTLFSYIVPLFMQRWGFMTTGTSADVQWRAIGQKYGNWSLHGRWPELLIAAPEIVAALTTTIFSANDGATASGFQAALARHFVQDSAGLARWAYARRCSKAVNTDVSGKSLYTDLIIPPIAVWLRPAAPALVAAGLAQAEVHGLDADLNARIDYPSPAVYQAAITLLTDFLASAHTSVAFGRLVERSNLLSADDAWVGYEGDDPAVTAGVLQLQQQEPDAVHVTMDAGEAAPRLTVRCQWLAAAGRDARAFTLTVSLLQWEQLRDFLEQQPSTMRASNEEVVAIGMSQSDGDGADEPPSRDDRPPLTAAGSSVSTASKSREASTESRESPLTHTLRISGLAGQLDESALIDVLHAAGGLQSVAISAAEGDISAEYTRDIGAVGMLLGLYGTITRDRAIWACCQQTKGESGSASRPHKFTQIYDARRVESAASTRVLTFGKRGNPSNLHTSLLCAKPPLSSFFTRLEKTVRSALLAVAAQKQSLVLSPRKELTVVEAGEQVLALSHDPFDFYGARLEFGELFLDSSKCTDSALLFCLREVLIEHLQVNRDDVAHVTPPEWFTVGGEAAARAAVTPLTLQTVGGVSVDVTRARLLCCPTFFKERPILLFVFHPASLDALKFNIFSPFVALCGEGIKPSEAEEILATFYLRLETLLDTKCAIVRPNVILIKYARIETQETPSTARFAAFLRLAHAARTFFHLLSSQHCLGLREEFFVDEMLLDANRTTLRGLCLDATGNAQIQNVAVASRQQKLTDWRALAALAAQNEPLKWNEAVQHAAFTRYATMRYLRSTAEEHWGSTLAVTKFYREVSVKAQSSSAGLELIQKQLKDYGDELLRALSARLQQLHQRGFHLLNCTDAVIEFCRRGTEFASLVLPDFCLVRDTHRYTNAEELQGVGVGWGSLPQWRT